MDIDKLKRITLEKIKNLDFDFTEEEVYIIAIDSTLFIEFHNQFIKNKNLINENIKLFEKIYNLSDESIFINIVDIYRELKEEMTESLLRQDMLCFDLAILKEKEEYFKIFEEKLTNDSLKLCDFYNCKVEEKLSMDFIVEKLLNNKNYKAIYNLTNYSTVKINEKNIFERLINEFPYKEYPINLMERIFVPKLYTKEEYCYELIKRIDLLNFATAFDIFFCPLDSSNRQIIANKIIELLKKDDNNFNIKVKTTKYFGNIYFNEMNKIIINNYNKPIKENNLFLYLTFNYDLNDIQINELCKIIKETDYDIEIYNKYLLTNDTFKKNIIDIGLYDKLSFYFDDKCLDYLKKQLNKAIEENDSDYLSKINILTSNNRIKNIILDLINRNEFDLICYDKKICSDEITTAIKKKIFELPLEELNKHEIFKEKVDNDLFLELINQNQIDKALTLSYKLDKKILINNFDSFKDKLKTNFTYAYKVFKILESDVVKTDEIRNLYLSLNVDYFTDKILEIMIHNDEYKIYYDKELYEYTIDKFIKKYSLNEKHVNILTEKYGYRIIKYINNSNLIEIINFDDDKFKKFIDLFPFIEYKINDLESIYDSFKQEEFSLQNHSVIEIFPNIMHGIYNKDENVLELFKELKAVWCDKLINKILSKYPDEESIIKSNIDYIDFVANKIINSSANVKEKYTNILHIISNYYIAIKREEYRKTYNMIEECKVKSEYNKKDMVKLVAFNVLEEQIVKVFSHIKVDEFYFKLLEYLKDKGLTNEEIPYAILYSVRSSFLKHIENDDYSLQIKIILGLNTPLDKFVKMLENTYKKLDNDPNIRKKAGLVLNYAFNNVEKYYDLNLRTNDLKKVKKDLVLSKPSYDIYELFSNIRLEFLNNCVLDNSEVYNALKNIIKKYKLDCICSNVDLISGKEIFDLSCQSNEISTFISFFHKIYEEEKASLESQGKDSKNLTISFMKIYKYLDKYADVSSIYSQILGLEDFRLIRSDPGPNSSYSITKEERLKKAIAKTFDNFKKQSIKIPGFYYDASLDNGKSLRAIVGNFTRPSNLTHGERTGACMRIGGAGETLFYSDDIFHIEFIEPNTEKYISRVTGFRNGNTVFLNELRYSSNHELYSNLDVVNACKQVAKQLIERTKKSSYPIDNVVIHRDYAMNEVEDDRVNLNVHNIKQGMKDFYTDVESYVHVLASTSKEGFTKVKLGNENVPDYQPVREKVRSGNDKIIVEQINRIYTIDQALQGKNYYIIPIVNNIIYGFVGEDWFVCIDENNQLLTYRIDRDERSYAEYEYAKEEIKKYYKDINEKEVLHAV